MVFSENVSPAWLIFASVTPTDQLFVRAAEQRSQHTERAEAARAIVVEVYGHERRLLPPYAMQVGKPLLAPIYAWFTEGFGTKDLKEARCCSRRWR
jgi:hypothetical protein